ncbi:MAG: endolytic transglycosylase MltG [Bacteroidales bacterium]|nr:endolytic transglycosylase MltG [Bacteroidales bacterium]
MKKQTLAIILVLAAVLAGCIVGALGLRRPTANSTPLRLNLPEGTDYKALCDSLSSNGIATGGTFSLMARAMRLNQNVRPGSYVVEPHMRQLALVRKLRNGQQDPIRLTIGKFRTPQQLNKYLNKKLMHDDFDVTLDSFHLVLQDTYEFYWTVSPEQFMQRMEDEYNRFWTTEVGPQGELRCDLLELSDNGNARLETMILASIVDEETNNNAEKPLIASVYINRLERGMPLQADPTVKYAVGDFTLKRILNKHLAVESPFNTYLHAGLPPAPICLPSKASIDAVINAKETNYLYFCASDKLDGTHRFAATLAEHNRNAARYHAAISRL